MLDARAVLFDMDGVLVDNSRFHVAAWTECARETLGIAIAPDDPRIHGGLNHEVVAALTGRAQTVEEARAFHDVKEARYRDLARGRLVEVRGVREYLAALRTRGVAVALVTSACAENTAFVLGELGLEESFAMRVLGDDVAHGKPHPEGYLLAASRLGVAPGDCLVHEDSVNGVRAAVAAGARVAALTTTTSAERLREVGASWVVADFAEWLAVEQAG